MQVLSDYEIVKVWETGQPLHPIDRALAILEASYSGKSSEELIALSIGRRDQCLLAIREHAMGRWMRAFAECPRCQLQVELRLDTTSLRAAGTDLSVKDDIALAVDGYEVRYRLPNSLDLAAIVGCDSVNAACKLLASRCIVQAQKHDSPVAFDDLPESVIEAVDEDMEKLDPLGSMQLDLSCPDCKHEWSVMLDIVSFFWTEIAEQAKLFLLDVHSLALAYGWSEAEILGMSPTRRRFYLEQII